MTHEFRFNKSGDIFFTHKQPGSKFYIFCLESQYIRYLSARDITKYIAKYDEPSHFTLI